jgi:prophage maintenance system killer protein
MDISKLITKEDLLRINKGFGGNLRNDSSIDFALDKLTDKKLGVYKKLAYLIRAILVDHPFSDGNKRTATFVCLAFATKTHKSIDREILIHHIISIAKDNIQEIRNIEWRLKNAIK